MILATIILAFSGLTLGLLTLLDRYETAVDKAHVDRRTKRASTVVYYDAFADRRQPRSTMSQNRDEAAA